MFLNFIEYSENDFVSEIVDKVFSRLIAEQKLAQVTSILKPGGLSHVPSKLSKPDVTHISGNLFNFTIGYCKF